MKGLLITSALLLCVSAINFKLTPENTRCIKEEAHKDVLVVGEFEIANLETSQEVDITVKDTKEHLLFSKEKAEKGKFAFTLDDYDMFSICFTSKRLPNSKTPPIDLEIKLSVKRGIEAKSYSDIAKAEKLKPMELELKKLEDLAEAIVSDFAYMKSREKMMRDTNESTNSRVLWFSIFSMAVLLGLALWQVFYLKRFFKAKKLIE